MSSSLHHSPRKNISDLRCDKQKKKKVEKTSLIFPSPPDGVTPAAQDNDGKETVDEGSATLRRSNRNIHAIRMKGTALTFYRRLQILFFSTKNKYQEIGGGRYFLQKVYQNPPIYVVDDFLSTSELGYFDTFANKAIFERSFVDNMQHDSSSGKMKKRTVLDSAHRTSTFFSFKKLHDSKITALEQRIASMLGCWIHQIEPLQLVRYKPGQFFGVHHDMGDLLENDSVLLPKKNIHVKRRLVTLFIYLNSLEKEQGGCTYFPKCNIRVQPQRGRLVIWSNTTKEGLPEPRTIHAGEPVRSEDENFIKYGLNIWICEE